VISPEEEEEEAAAAAATRVTKAKNPAIAVCLITAPYQDTASPRQ